MCQEYKMASNNETKQKINKGMILLFSPSTCFFLVSVTGYLKQEEAKILTAAEIQMPYFLAYVTFSWNLSEYIHLTSVTVAFLRELFSNIILIYNRQAFFFFHNNAIGRIS